MANVTWPVVTNQNYQDITPRQNLLVFMTETHVMCSLLPASSELIGVNGVLSGRHFCLAETCPLLHNIDSGISPY